MIKIGDKTVIYQVSLIVPDKEIARFEVPEPWGTTVELQFHPEASNPDAPGKATWVWAFKDGIFHIDLNGAKGPLGVAPTAPVRVGLADIGGEALGMLFYHHRTGVMNKVDFLFLSGGHYD